MFKSTAQDRARTLKDSASTALAKGKVEAALQDFRKAVQLTPQDLSARKKIAEILVRLNRRQEAVTEYQHLVGRYAADGQLIQAMAVCKVILQLEPTHTATQELLANLYSKKSGPAGHWVEKLPPTMAGALDFKHVKARPPEAAAEPEAPADEVPIEVAGADEAAGGELAVEVDIDVSQVPPTPLFSELPKEAFLAILDRVAMHTVPAGTAIIIEGEKGSSMFILVQGVVDVVRNTPGGESHAVARMAEGSFFGEMGLMSEGPRLAGVVAAQDCVLLELTREMLQELAARFPSVEPVMQKFYRERLLANLLRSSPLFRPFSEAQKEAIVNRFTSRTVEPGTVLVRQGQPGDGLHLLLRGRCHVIHEDAGGAERPYPDMGEGAVFGEIALLLGAGATATVRAATACVVLTLDKEAFGELVLGHPEVRRMIGQLSRERLLRTADLLAGEDKPVRHGFVL
jgi:CRP-like cAMP-binding protein